MYCVSRVKTSKTSSIPTAARARLPLANLLCATCNTAQSSSWNARASFASTKPLYAPVRLVFFPFPAALHTHAAPLAPIAIRLIDCFGCRLCSSSPFPRARRREENDACVAAKQGVVNIVKFTSEINVVQLQCYGRASQNSVWRATKPALRRVST